MKDACTSIAPLLEKYFDRQATDEEQALVEKHLSFCSTCIRRLKELEGLREMIKSPVDRALQEETFPWVWEKIEKGIRQKEKSSWWETLPSWLDLSHWLRKKVWIPAIATALVLAFIMAPLFFKKTSSHMEPTVVEYVESQFYNVMVYESEKVTVIWLLETTPNGYPAS